MSEFRFNPERFELRGQACGPLAFLLHRRGEPDAVRVIKA
jgi:hypothetical protein